MEGMNKFLIGLSILALLIVLTNIYLLIKYPMITKLIPIPPIKL